MSVLALALTTRAKRERADQVLASAKPRSPPRRAFSSRCACSVPPAFRETLHQNQTLSRARGDGAWQSIVCIGHCVWCAHRQFPARYPFSIEHSLASVYTCPELLTTYTSRYTEAFFGSPLTSAHSTPIVIPLPRIANGADPPYTSPPALTW